MQRNAVRDKTFVRYGIYFVPDAEEAWARFCTHWLGWNLITGQVADHPEIEGCDFDIADVTAVPRRYGFHATMKPPFRLRPGRTFDELDTAFEDLAQAQAPVKLDGLEISQMGRFLGLTPVGPVSQLNALAAACVRDLDGFRADLTETEIARRRASRLSADQDAMLLKWGYPHVMKTFRFHMTLSGKIPNSKISKVASVLTAELGKTLPTPFEMRRLTLVGEDEHGIFHMIRQAKLAG